MSQGRLSAVPPPHEAITYLSSPTRGSSFLAGSTDTTSLTTCISWTLRRQRISPKSQVSVLTRSDRPLHRIPFLHLVLEGNDINYNSTHHSPLLSFFFFFSIWALFPPDAQLRSFYITDNGSFFADQQSIIKTFRVSSCSDILHMYSHSRPPLNLAWP